MVTPQISAATPQPLSRAPSQISRRFATSRESSCQSIARWRWSKKFNHYHEYVANDLDLQDLRRLQAGLPIQR